MVIIDDNLLDEFRTPGKCEYCGKWAKAREPHHLWCKGHGGGGRLDIRPNLVALGSSLILACTCHTDHHAKKEPTHYDLLAIACQREGLLQRDIEALVWFLLRCPKECLGWQVEKAMDGMTGSGKQLAKRFLRERRQAS